MYNSPTNTPSPDSTIATLMQFLTDTAEHLAEPIHIINDMMRNIIVTRDRMIHRLSTANEPLNKEQRESLVTSLQEFAVEAENLGLPLIPQEIIEGFLERTRPREVLTEVTAQDALIAAVTRIISTSATTQTDENRITIHPNNQIIIHPADPPPTFTVQAESEILNDSD